jgi:hypothetical protein
MAYMEIVVGNIVTFKTGTITLTSLQVSTKHQSEEYSNVSQPVVPVPPGVRGRFRRGTLRDIKNLTFYLYHILTYLLYP